MPTASAHRRPLATAAVAAGLLSALWFVPSANASPEAGHSGDARAVPTAAEAGPHDPGVIAQPRLREDGGFDSTPYVAGGAVVAGAGGVLALRAVRRRRP